KVSRPDGLIRSRVKRHNFSGRGIESVLRNNVSGERRPSGLAIRGLSACRVIKLEPAPTTEQTGEIAVYHRLRRDSIEPSVADVLDGPACRGDARSLIIAEDKEPILDYGSAGRGSKLILLERTTGR